MTDALIILAPPRSFTSVVCAMLGQHPEMYGLPEVNLFAAETMRERAGVLRQRVFAEQGLLRVVAQILGSEQTVQTIALARRWVDFRRQSACVSVLREVADRVAPRIPVDKSPLTTMRIEYMQRARRAFPSVRFLHLLRHPRGQGESLWKLGGPTAVQRLGGLDYGTPTPTPDPQKLWYTLHSNICGFLDGLPKEQWLRLRGEDVLADPDTHLVQIVQWLGLRDDAAAIEEMKHPERSPYAGFGPINARFGNDPQFLRDPALRPHRAKAPVTLDGPLPWRRDGAGFSPEVVQLAAEFGYA